MDGLPIEGGNEAAVQGFDDPFDGFIGGMLLELQFMTPLFEAIIFLDHGQELAGRAGQDGGRLVEHVEKPFFTGNEIDAHDGHLSLVICPLVGGNVQ